jgi:hypothetical protein
LGQIKKNLNLDEKHGFGLILDFLKKTLDYLKQSRLSEYLGILYFYFVQLSSLFLALNLQQLQSLIALPSKKKSNYTHLNFQSNTSHSNSLLINNYSATPQWWKSKKGFNFNLNLHLCLAAILNFSVIFQKL